MLTVLIPSSAGWSVHWSDDHHRSYYFADETGDSSWTLPPGASLQPPPAPPAVPTGWVDCTADAAGLFGGSASTLQRVWRHMVRSSHPDKGGTAEAFTRIGEARDYLSSPLRYFAHRTLHSHLDPARRRPLRSFDGEGVGADDAALVLGVRAALEMDRSDSEPWPRLRVDASLRAPSDVVLSERHVWRVALAHADASTIEYKGDNGAGGFDVCCGFVRGSTCVLRPRDEAVAWLDEKVSWHARVDAAGHALVHAADHERTRRSTLAWHEQREAHYVRHDCERPWPRGGLLNASVSKPLHLKAAGSWAAVLLVFEGADEAASASASRASSRASAEPVPDVCLALHVDVAFPPRPPASVPPQPEATASRAEVAWVQQSHGRWCRDGADLLEGPLDDYTDCPPGGLCALTRKCRQRCARRRECAFYTSYVTGYCQLSSQCSDEAPASDVSARTFRKEVAGAKRDDGVHGR